MISRDSFHHIRGKVNHSRIWTHFGGSGSKGNATLTYGTIFYVADVEFWDF